MRGLKTGAAPKTPLHVLSADSNDIPKLVGFEGKCRRSWNTISPFMKLTSSWKKHYQ